MAFVQMIDARRDSQRAKGFHTTDTKQQLLANASPLVAAIETICQLAVLGLVTFDVGIQQIQLHPTHADQPHLGKQLTVASVNLDRDGLPVGASRRFERRVLDLGILILFALVSVFIQVLAEVALAIEQPDRDERNAQAARTLDVVTR